MMATPSQPPRHVPASRAAAAPERHSGGRRRPDPAHTTRRTLARHRLSHSEALIGPSQRNSSLTATRKKTSECTRLAQRTLVRCQPAAWAVRQRSRLGQASGQGYTNG